jgi:hypothetical protein
MAGASVYHIAISLSNPPTHIQGIEEILYTNTENTTLNEVGLAAFSEILGGSISIEDFKIDGKSITVVPSNGIMRVTLPKPLEPGKSLIFHIEFTVEVPTLGGGYYYGIFGYNDGILSMAHAYPTILVYNEQGWNNQTPDLDGDPLFSDASFYLVSIDAPRNLVVAASGVEIQRTEKGDRQQILIADGPARDFYLAASSNFRKNNEKIGEVTINSYSLPQFGTYAQSALNYAKAALEDFSNRYTPYPYTEFDIVPIVTSAGGVEYPGMTAVAEEAYQVGPLLEDVLAHEVGHQWFYNLVGNETQRQPWLDESLAQFVTWQYFLDQHGDTGAQLFQTEIQGNWDIVKDKKIPIGEPVSAYTGQEYVAIVYGRGPFFFMALRQQMGVQSFDSLMSDYPRTYAWKIATTEAFQKLAEKHCNCDLTTLFNEWVNP